MNLRVYAVHNKAQSRLYVAATSAEWAEGLAFEQCPSHARKLENLKARLVKQEEVSPEFWTFLCSQTVPGVIDTTRRIQRTRL